MTQTRGSDYTLIYLQSAGLTVLACGPAALVMTMNGWSEHASLLEIFGSVFVGICAWGLGLWYLRHPIYREILVAGRHFLGSVARRT